MFKHIKDNKGFSLIELMVVVAIIGILAAIAVPTFTGFQKRARSTEGTNALGAFYTAQAAYHAEHSYYGSVSDVGFDHDSDGNYAVGFTGDVKGAALTGTLVNCRLAKAAAGTALTGSDSADKALFFTAVAVGKVATTSVVNSQINEKRKIYKLGDNDGTSRPLTCNWTAGAGR